MRSYKIPGVHNSNGAHKFRVAALFAPVDALKYQNDMKRAVGAAFLQRWGVKGLHIQQGYLEAKLEEMFHELDADGGGSICFKELSKGLATMGVVVSDAELKKFLQDFDDDDNMYLVLCVSR
jgi:hypothetical protein